MASIRQTYQSHVEFIGKGNVQTGEVVTCCELEPMFFGGFVDAEFPHEPTERMHANSKAQTPSQEISP